MPTYKLHYFNLRARGELIRLLFAAADVRYEDHRIDFKDWLALKPSTPLRSLAPRTCAELAASARSVPLPAASCFGN